MCIIWGILIPNFFFIVCLKSKFNGSILGLSLDPNPRLKAPFQARVSGEGLTADNHSVILNPVVIVVHVGAAALVEDLLIATVMCVTAPEGGGRSDQTDVGG